MRIIITVLCVVTLSWLYVGAPIGVKETVGEIKPLSRSAEIPEMKLKGKTLAETMMIRKKQAEERKEKALKGEIYGNPKWTQIHRDLVSAFENLKSQPCDEGYIKTYADMVSEYFIYARKNADNGTLKPVDYDLAKKAQRVLGESIREKYIVKKDLSSAARKIFALNNTERVACQ